LRTQIKSNGLLAGVVALALVSACSDDSETVANDTKYDLPDVAQIDVVDAAQSDVDTNNQPDAGQPDLGELDLDVATCWQVPLQSSVTNVQPMTGIVIWEDSWDDDLVKTQVGNVQLEYAYVAPGDLSTGPGTYDWSKLDQMLDRIKAHKHQAIIRFYYTYPGKQTGVPAWIKALNSYQETTGTSEGKQTWFPDWSNQNLKDFHTDFYTAFAARYDQDPRLAFLQTGFGLWAEYHIYDGPNRLGHEFPDKEYQTAFLTHLSQVLPTLPWSISIDAGESDYSPIEANAALMNLKFGLFDDSFMHEDHGAYNTDMWNLFGYTNRYKNSPHGGEFSYYTDFDQEHVLDVAGIYGRTFQDQAAKFHISYMIGNDQPDYQTVARIKEAGMQSGYRFRISSFESCDGGSTVMVTNEGVAPIYYDAFVAIDGVRSDASLKGLLPGQTWTIQTLAGTAVGGQAPTLTIESDRLVAGQVIEFAADLQ